MKRLVLPFTLLCLSVSTATAQNWSGFYAGIHGGVAQSKASTTAVTASNFFPVGHAFGSSNADGYLGGVQAGYNFQSGAFLLGIEGDFSWSSVQGRNDNASPLLANRSTINESTQNWVGTIAARLGYVVSPSMMLYGKAGWGWADYDAKSWSRNTVNGAVLATAAGGEVRDGYLLGLGGEYMMSRNWSVKAEYNFIDFGKDRVNRVNTSGANIGLVNVRDTETEMHAVKLGLNYRF